MKRGFVKIVFFIGFIFLLNSCGIYDGYYYKIKKNKKEFNSIITYIKKNKFFEKTDYIVLDDSTNIEFNRKCIYYNKYKQKGTAYMDVIKKHEQKPIHVDSTIIKFMNEYDLNRICLEKRDDKFYNTVIVFHKDYNPIIGSSKTIEYDYGVSPIRNKLENGERKFGGGIYCKIIDSTLIYSIDKTPAFGQ